MGTPEFAVPSLDILVEQGFEICAVITAPDKPAGRGRKISQSAVKKYALENSIPILQPTNLKDPAFIKDLEQLHANLQIVVAFRMLPKIIWAMPQLGTFNLHASLLPQYRGAAPINWAIINGEKKTGITTFFLKEEIDTGNIIFQKEIEIVTETTAGQLHDKLMEQGSKLVLKTVKSILAKDYKLTEQTDLTSENEELNSAPKIFKNDCRINWSAPSQKILCLIKGLSPYPAAYTMINSENQDPIQLKIFDAEKKLVSHQFKIGQILCDGKSKLEIATKDGLILLKELQLAGKKRMKTEDFLRGFLLKDGWIAQ